MWENNFIAHLTGHVITNQCQESWSVWIGNQVVCVSTPLVLWIIPSKYISWYYFRRRIERANPLLRVAKAYQFMTPCDSLQLRAWCVYKHEQISIPYYRYLRYFQGQLRRHIAGGIECITFYSNSHLIKMRHTINFPWYIRLQNHDNAKPILYFPFTCQRKWRKYDLVRTTVRLHAPRGLVKAGYWLKFVSQFLFLKIIIRQLCTLHPSYTVVVHSKIAVGVVAKLNWCYCNFRELYTRFAHYFVSL